VVRKVRVVREESPRPVDRRTIPRWAPGFAQQPARSTQKKER
jgi:hypothetical protein